MTPEEAYEKVCELAREHALIWQAGSGFVMIVHPDTQGAEGIWEQIQYMHGKGKHPRTLELERELAGVEASKEAPQVQATIADGQMSFALGGV